MAKTISAMPLKGGKVRDFSGGPNIRDSAPELADNEVVDAYNVTSDERGGVSSRLGQAKYNTSVFHASNLVKNGYWWKSGGKRIWQVGPSLYVDTSVTSVQTFTTAARVTFTEMAGKLIVAHPIDGIFTSADAATFTVVADPDAPTTGTCVAVWQNKLYVGGLAQGKVQWSDAGDPLAWTATAFVQIRAIDDQNVVALEVASGLDISGRAGLLALKRRSSYRIFDSSTGEYEVVDATVGTASALSVASIGAKVITLCERGVFWWQEGLAGFQAAGSSADSPGSRLEPLWKPEQINFSQLDLCCAGRKGYRVRFSLPKAGSTANDLSLEYHPDQGWIYPGSNAVSCYVNFGTNDEILYGGSPSVAGQVYKMDSGGGDDGVAIAWRLQTRWFELNNGFAANIWQVRLHGRGAGTLTVRTDYEEQGGDVFSFDLSQAGITYDSGLTYDSGQVYVIPNSQFTQAFYSIGTARQVSFRFTGSTTTVSTGPELFGLGVSPDIGAFGLVGAEYLYIPLGLS